MAFHFKLITPENVSISEDLESLTCDTELGQITILQNHTPMIANLVPGELIMKGSNSQTFLSLSGGVLSVESGGDVMILADEALHIEDLSVEEAEKAIEKGKHAIKQGSLSELEYAKTAASIEHALSKLKIARRRHKGHMSNTRDFDNIPN